jgi:hypothetical protein
MSVWWWTLNSAWQTRRCESVSECLPNQLNIDQRLSNTKAAMGGVTAGSPPPSPPWCYSGAGAHGRHAAAAAAFRGLRNTTWALLVSSCICIKHRGGNWHRLYRGLTALSVLLFCVLQQVVIWPCVQVHLCCLHRCCVCSVLCVVCCLRQLVCQCTVLQPVSGVVGCGCCGSLH